MKKSLRYIKWLIILMLIVMIGSAFAINMSKASFLDAEASNGSTAAGWTSTQWTQTSQTDFESGVGSSVNTTLSPGDVILPIVPNSTIIAADSSTVQTTVTGALLVKTLNFTKSGPVFDEIRIDSSIKNIDGSQVTSSIRLNDVEIFTHTTSSTSYIDYADTFNFSGYADGSYTLKLYLTADSGTGYNQTFALYTTSPVLITSDNSTVNHSGDTVLTLEKTLTVNKSGPDYNTLTVSNNLMVDKGTGYSEIYVDDVLIFNHTTTNSAAYDSYNDQLDFSGYADGDHTVKLYIGIGHKNDIVYNSVFMIWGTSPSLVISDNTEQYIGGIPTYELKKLITFTKDGITFSDLRIANNLMASGSTAYISIRIDDVEVATHTTTSTTYVNYNDTINTTALSDGSHNIKLYLKTAKKNQPAYNTIFEIYRTKTYAASGTIASQVLNTGFPGSRWDALFWDKSLPSGTNITFEVRASDTPFLYNAASPSWQAVGGASPVLSGLTTGRYQQWRGTLTADAAHAYTPVLQEVRTYYYGY